MLDLEPRVHLEKGELAGAGIEHELDRARGAIRAGASERDRGVGECPPRGRREQRRGCLLDELLVSPLERAVAFAERDHLAGPVAEDLHLYVAGGRDALLEEARGVTEVLTGEPAHPFERPDEIRLGVATLHPDAAAARAALEHHRVADARRGGGGFVEASQHVGAGEQRHPRGAGQGARGILAAELLDVLGRGPDPRKTGGLARARERGVLRYEAVAGMHRVGAGTRGRVEQAFTVEVALRGRRGPEVRGMVGERDVRRVPVGVGVHRHRLDPHTTECPENADRDLAAVRDEDALH